MISAWSERGQQLVLEQIADNGGEWPPPEELDFANQDLSAADIQTLVARATPHPGRTLTEPATLVVPLDAIPSTYIKCLVDGDAPSEDVRALLTSPAWALKEIATGHWPMFSQPQALAAALVVDS